MSRETYKKDVMSRVNKALQKQRVTNQLSRASGLLTQLSLSRNYLSGSIPSTFGNLANLESVWMIGMTEALSVSWLPSTAGLSGPLPSELGLMTSLTTLELCLNKLTGPIPSTLRLLSNLSLLGLWGNLLTGEVPEEICQLRNKSGLFPHVGDRSVMCSCC